MLPKLIHQIWLGPKEPPWEWIQSWKRLNPTWEHRLWRDPEMQFLISNWKQYQDLEGTPDVWGARTDLFRYEVLYKFGGMYVDADVEALRPLDDEFAQQSLFFTYESESARPGLVTGAVMGAYEGHPFLANLINQISLMTTMHSRPNWQQVGPGLITRSLQKFPGIYKIYPSGYFMPEHYSGALSTSDREPYATHHFYTTHQLAGRSQ